MNSLDIWMRENPITYVVLGSYAVALIIFAVEVVLVRHKRKITLDQIRMMRESEEDE
jgi:uncharacterized protein YoxC